MRHFLLHFLIFLTLQILAESKESSPPQALQFAGKIIREFMENQGVHGVSAALVYEGKGYLLHFGEANPGSGIPVDKHTIFELGSITKVFTSTAMAFEILHGRMSLDDPIVKYLPSLRRPRAIRYVTLEDLATHTSSLPRVPPKHGKKRPHFSSVMVFLQHWEPNYQIGSRYVYSNLGFGILGYALANLEDESYAEVIKGMITGPLNMHSTFIQVPAEFQSHYAQGFKANGQPASRWPLNPWPAGGALRSTSQDMLKFLEANLNLSGPEDLRKAMQLTQKGFFEVNPHLTMGLGWQRFNKNNVLIIDKNGGVTGFSTYIGMIPSSGIGIVLLANRAKTGITATGRKILNRLNGFKKNAGPAELHN